MEIPVSSVLLVLLVSAVSAIEHTFTTVKLHEAATLQCFKRCSGLVKWTQVHKHKDVLAQCDQTSCQSQEGYQMSHDEYLKGNLSLTITDADFSKRMWYTCQCDDKDICDVTLKLKPFSEPVRVHVGEDLLLDLPISDDVEMIFNRSDDVGSNSLKLCTVEGRKAECDPSYEKRVSVGFCLQLKDVKKHDGGVYIVRDTKNDEVIGTYTVSETNSKNSGNSPAGDQDECVGTLYKWLFIGTLVVSILVIVVQFVVIVLQFVKNRQLQKHLRQNQHTPINMQHVQQYSPVKDAADGPVTDVEKQNGDLKADTHGHVGTDSLVNLTSVTHSS